MHRKWVKWLASRIGMGRLFKIGFNLSPMYRRTGGRVLFASEKMDEIRIKLPLNYKTRNYVGTLYGGHMYSCVDGIYMIQLMYMLGDEYIVWDKSATIHFKRPGTETLYTHFKITSEVVEAVREEVHRKGEKDVHLSVNMENANGDIHAIVEKVIYVATKEFYREKIANRK